MYHPPCPKLFSKKYFRLLFSMMLLIFLMMTTGVLASEQTKCAMCGMDLSRYVHTRYEITTTSGKKFVTCGVQCGLLLQLNLGDTFKSATATDLLTHKTIPADKAWYVFHASVITDMAPGFIAFASREDAEKFIKGFGGELIDYRQALEKIKQVKHCKHKGKDCPARKNCDKHKNHHHGS